MKKTFVVIDVDAARIGPHPEDRNLRVIGSVAALEKTMFNSVEDAIKHFSDPKVKVTGDLLIMECVQILQPKSREFASSVYTESGELVPVARK